MTDQTRRLHLGCGLNTPDGWINLDGSWNARLAKYSTLRKLAGTLHLVSATALDVSWNRDITVHDVRKPLPFPDQSLDAIYSSHLLEHLYFEEAKRLLKECYRVLRPGGVLRIVVPDLRAIVLEYLGQQSIGVAPEVSNASSPADRLNQRLLLRSSQPPSGGILYRIYTSLMDFHSHKWLYDVDSLCWRFNEAGFIEIEQKLPHVSRIEGIVGIEQTDRILHGAGICIEGIKPS